MQAASSCMHCRTWETCSVTNTFSLTMQHALSAVARYLEHEDSCPVTGTRPPASEQGHCGRLSGAHRLQTLLHGVTASLPVLLNLCLDT